MKCFLNTGDPDEGKVKSFAESISESPMSPQHSVPSTKVTSTPEDKSGSRHLEYSHTTDEVPEEVTSMVEEEVVEEGEDEEESEVKLRLDLSKSQEVKQAVQSESQLPTTARSVKSITEDILTETKSLTKDLDKSSKQKSKSDSRDSKSSKYSADYGDESEHSETHRTDKSFTYSTSSRTERSYTEEFTEATTGKSSPRRKDPSGSGSKKSPAEPSIVESINTEEEVSEQLDAETDEEDGEVMLELDTPPVASPKLEVDPLSRIQIGDRVLVGGAQPGTLSFKGYVKFATGYFGGIVLDKPEGTNDGSKEGVQYFECKDNYGIFAPPEKLAPLPEDWRDEELQSAAGSDLSEATLHEDEEEDEKRIAALRRDVTKPISETSEKKSHKETEESIPEDVSVATTVDSELERVISSAAAAVESFGEDLEVRSGAASPVDTTISDSTTSFKDRRPPDLEKVVDKVTDGILHMVVKDSLEAVSDVTQKAKTTPVPSQAKSSITADQTVSEVEREDSSEEKVGGHKDQAVEVATQKLLNESISQILNIYKKKQKSSDDDNDSPDSPEGNKLKPVTKPSDDELQTSLDKQVEKQKKHTDILILDNDNKFDPFGSSSNSFGRPDKVRIQISFIFNSHTNSKTPLSGTLFFFY